MAKKDLVPFKKGEDPRRNVTGLNAGSGSMTAGVKRFLQSRGKDGKTYGEKLEEAAVLRAINKSDVMAKEIWDRVDGKVPQDFTSGGEPIKISFDQTFEK